MRTTKTTSRFKKDVKREAGGQYKRVLQQELPYVLSMLMHDVPLPEKFADHALSGAWTGYRECHIKPDLLLVYQKSDRNMLELARLGSHSELGF